MDKSERMEQQLPEAFLKETSQILGADMPLFLNSLQSESPVSIHINNKTNLVQTNQQVTWYANGSYLSFRPQFTLDPLWHAGVYYVQEASSMFLFQFLKQYVSTQATVLDMCAAPGGKSIVASQYLTQGCLVSNEYIRTRSRILAENITKWGNDNVIVTSNAPECFEKLPHLFDAVIVDAPCSGEGMFRKDENAIAEWSEANVANCVVRQQNILQSAWQSLAPGGVLIYSTCTYNRHENEEMVQWLIDEFDAELLKIDLDTEWNITETSHGYRFFPHKTIGEGLFMAALRKPEAARRSIKIKSNKSAPVCEKQLLNQLMHPERYTLMQKDDTIFAIPVQLLSIYQYVATQCYILTAGVPLALCKGKSLIPEAGLALSKALNLSQINAVIDVDRTTALRFLQKEAIMINHSQKEYVLITYQNIPLGWLKHLGNRSNNLYPDAWRIRMNIPQELPELFY